MALAGIAVGLLVHFLGLIPMNRRPRQTPPLQEARPRETAPAGRARTRRPLADRDAKAMQLIVGRRSG